MVTPFILSIRDENASGKLLQEVQIEFKTDTASVAEIIEARVRQEVDSYNRKMPEYFRGLVAPTDAEQTLNGIKLKKRKPIDAEKQVYVALDAFQKNGFFVLADNLQCTDLQQRISINSNTHISFVKLTPLVGG